ncbi:MAG: LCP family protein, partial [Oscillospiraceae bacterium]
QIPRDTYVGESVKTGGTGKINAVYSHNNGIEGTAAVVNDMFKVPIDHYVTLTLDGFRYIVDAMGGVEVDVPVYINLEGEEIFPGKQVLTGFMADKFVRERKSYATSDLKRIEMQQLFIKAMVQKVMTMGKKDMVKLITDSIKYLTTDLTLKNILDYYNAFTKLDGVNSINFHSLPIAGARGGSVLSVKAKPTADILNEYFRPYMPKVPYDDLGVIELVTNYEYQSQE